MSRSRSPAGGWALRRPPPATDAGVTLIELLVVITIVVAIVAIAAPMTASAIEAGRAQQAAAFVAARFRLAHHQAAAQSTSVGVLFDVSGGRTTFRVCRDGNGNGLRRAEADSGVDPCVDGPYDVGVLYPGVTFEVDPTLRGPDNEPGSPDAIRLGHGDLASFSPVGTCTAGSVFLRSRSGLQYVVRLAGATSRTRTLLYDASTRAWRER